MAVAEEVLGNVPWVGRVPDRVAGGREGALLDLRRPPHPEPGVADVLRHRRVVADLRPHVPPLRHAVRVATGSPRRSTATSTRPPCRPTRRSAARRPSTRPATSRACRATPSTPARSAPTSAGCSPSTRATSSPGGVSACARRSSATSSTWTASTTTPRHMREMAVYLEDAIDVHDRHWKIHWMLNFAQFSSTTNLNAVIAEVRGGEDPGLMGRLQSSLEDRNWDSIEDLWKLKEEIKGDDELLGGLRGRDGGRRDARARRLGPREALRRGADRRRTRRRSATSRSGRTSSPSRPGARTRRRSSRRSAATSRPTTTTRRTSSRSATTSRPRRSR